MPGVGHIFMSEWLALVVRAEIETPNYPRRVSRMSCRTLLFFPILLLSGCANPFPEGIPTAMIRFTSNVPTIIKPICGRDNFIRQGFIKNDYLSEMSPVKMYGTRSDKNNEVIERLIPAERALPFRVRWGHAGVSGSTIKVTQCDAVFSFKPLPREQYEADYVLGANSCDLKLYRLSERNGAVQKTEVKFKRYSASEDTDKICRGEV